MPSSISVLLACLASIPLPARPVGAPSGTAAAKSVADLPLKEREERLVAEILRGNVPNLLREFVPIKIKKDGHELVVEVAPDYLAVGGDEDFFRVPLSPVSAQSIADRLDCRLPTTKLVDEIHKAAAVQLPPAPIPPSAEMTTVPVFLKHDRMILAQLGPKKGLIAGHKKDVVITSRLAKAPGKVAIYGWHKLDGRPIQGLYLGHTSAWVDYSHGIRLIRNAATLDGKPTTIDAILKDPALCGLISDEGVVDPARYTAKELPPSPRLWPKETTEELRFEPGVRALINRVDPLPGQSTLLVFYALPNGNTIEWTAGKRMKPGDDWHFDIQHIDAQTRWLRRRMPDRHIVVVYLENDLKAWPAWRRKNGDARIPEILGEIRKKFKPDARVVLNGHSGGGSLIFGYLNTVERIPDEIERIAFLDSNYAYETARHRDKLTTWLKSADHFLCVLAYHDAIALLNGKTFVSAEGGTWGRSKVMLADLEPTFPLKETRAGEMRRVLGLDGRIEFYLRENPEKKIYHTTQVERNGFIESMLSGTKLQGVDYEYFGDRAYSHFIEDKSAAKP